MITLVTGVVGVLLLLAFIGFVMNSFYQKATPERALVKTGSGKGKAIINGGTIVIPIFHEVMRVGMKTLKIDVSQSGADAFITKDHRRVDIDTEFYIRVKPNEQSVMLAASTLGGATLDHNKLLPFVEGKLIGALRTAAATMDLMELHEKRDKFVENVQLSVTSDLEANGLELESAAVTSLDQTPLEHLRETNVFDAEGMRAIAEITNKKKEERSQLDQTTRVEIANQEKNAEKQVIAAERETEEARIEKNQQIAEKTAASEALAKKAQEKSARETEEARIERERAVEAADVDKQKAVKLAAYKAEEETAEASKAVSAKEAEAAEAKASKVIAEEAVITAQQKAEAERKKSIDIIAAERDAEVGAASIRITAEVEKQAELDRAEALRIKAEARADADKKEAEGIKAKGEALAYAEEMMVSARNQLAPAIITFETQKLTIERLPDIIRELARPAENIDNFTVFQGSMPGVAGEGGSVGTTGNLMEDFFGSMRRNAVFMPFLKQALEGVEGSEAVVDQVETAFNITKPKSSNGHDHAGLRSVIDNDDWDEDSDVASGVDLQG